MIDKIGHIKNPLTVIAMFAGIAEISGTLVLPFIEPTNQGIYIWFLMLFPVGLVGIFFATLNFNHKVLYAPSDYKDEDNFIKLFAKASIQEKANKLREEVIDADDITTQPLGEEIVKNQGELNIEETTESNNETKNIYQKTLLADVSLAEKLAILKLSKDLNLDFKADVKVESLSNQKVIFDGLAFHNNQVHAVEVKLFKNKILLPVRFDRILKESELISNKMKIMGSKFILHIVVVVDNPEIDIAKEKNYLEQYLDKFNFKIQLHIFNLSDLTNEYQYCA